MAKPKPDQTADTPAPKARPTWCGPANTHVHHDGVFYPIEPGDPAPDAIPAEQLQSANWAWA